MKAVTLPTSRALPPPKAMTPSQPPARKASTPAATSAPTGLEWIVENSVPPESEPNAAFAISVRQGLDR
jgi:hypothetical protein